LVRFKPTNSTNETNKTNLTNLRIVEPLNPEPIVIMDSINKIFIRPPRLMPGDTIGIVAPAGPFDPEIFSQGLSTVESLGKR
jgi:hypothetical protein